MNNSITKRMEDLSDERYREFLKKLIPEVDIENIIGIRAPILKDFKKSLSSKEKEHFITTFPHRFLEENTLHMLILSEIKDFDTYIEKLEELIPHIDNWATCDSVTSNLFAKNIDKSELVLKKWSRNDHPYSQRLVCVILLKYFSKEAFKPKHIELIDSMKSDNYYVKMGKAWYLSYLLIYHFDEIIALFEKPHFEKWVHNKAIQKAVESLRVSIENKEYLKGLRIAKTVR